ncbi:MAG: InlB B-repeat-containing protein [Treponema sp.]|jgi:uncharacterized repeat protein (TIGR02543 family)|nr:InlB B-repeat-containing protein [Treponema sp.]
MKNKSLYLGLVALVVAMSVVLIACKDDDPETSPATFTVTFNSNDGTAEADPTTKTVTDGQTVDTLPDEPTKTNYTFAGWNTAKNGSGTAFTASTKVTANITVYAQWTENTTDVDYTLLAGENGAELKHAGLSIESAKKGAASGVTTVVLTGTIDHGIPTGLEESFVVAQFTTETSAEIPTQYSAFVIEGLDLGIGVHIKQTNKSFILYKGGASYGAGAANWPDQNGIYVEGDDEILYKDKTYTADYITADDDTLSILFADGVTPETAKLEITPVGKSTYTVIIDWSRVIFNPANGE